MSAIQSTYFIQIFLTSTFFIQSLELLRVSQLSTALLRLFIGPRATRKERSKRWGVIYSLEDPPDFWHAETFAANVLYYLVFFVYATIAPVTSFFLLFCIVLLEAGYRYQFVHNYPRAFDTGGRLWQSFIHFTLASMVIAQLTLIGFLLLKKSIYAGPALGPLLAGTILYIFFVNAEPSRVGNFLPSRDCVFYDHRYAEEGASFSFVKNAYLQPALRNDPVEPEYED